MTLNIHMGFKIGCIERLYDDFNYKGAVLKSCLGEDRDTFALVLLLLTKKRWKLGIQQTHIYLFNQLMDT